MDAHVPSENVRDMIQRIILIRVENDWQRRKAQLQYQNMLTEPFNIPLTINIIIIIIIEWYVCRFQKPFPIHCFHGIRSDAKMKKDNKKPPHELTIKYGGIGIFNE